MAGLTDITAIAGYAGKFYPKIIRKIMAVLDIANDVELLRNVTAPRQLWGFNASEGMRPLDYNVEDTTGSNGEFTLRSIVPEIAMRIIKIIPEEYRDTFFSETLDENAKDVPFAEYFWDQHVKTIAAEINNNAYFGISAKSIAAFNSTTVYTTGQKVKYSTLVDGMQYYEAVATTTAGETPISAPTKWKNINNKCLAKGFATIIEEETTSLLHKNITVTGAITNTTAVDQIDGAMWAAIPNVVKKYGVQFLMAPSTYDKRVKNLRTKKESGSTFSDSEYEDSKKTIIDSEGKGTIKPVSWMEGSGRVIWTIPKNMIMCTNQLPGANPFGPFVQGLQSSKTIMKVILGYQISDFRYFGTNDIR